MGVLACDRRGCDYVMEERNKEKPLHLKSSKLFWNEGSRTKLLLDKPEGLLLSEIDRVDLELLLKELDRRLVQYADKVSYEKEKGYVNYRTP